MGDEISEIRSRVDILDLVGQTVSLKRVGKTYKGLCPFHDDHNPSFVVNPDTGTYICWSCKERGDIFNWVMKTQNLTFGEAVRLLGEKAGVKVSKESEAQRSIRMNQRAAMDTALAFFKEQLAESQDALQYCDSRGLDGALRAEWELGYAPENGEALTAWLLKKGFRLADCKPLFLVDGDERGYHDKFRGRLMFPIRDEKGELVGFGGRVLGQGSPKYINSSDTPLYKKSRVLYGMNKAKDAMRETNRAVLVEGYLDVIACHTAGVKSAVASLGTSLATDQAKLLKRWCDEVTILYDSDAAGQKAAERAAQIFSEAELRVNVALVPEGKDPDTLLRSLGPQAVKDAASAGISPLDFKLRTLEGELGLDSDEFWKKAVEVLRAEPNALERTRFAEALAPKYPKIRDVAAAKRALVQMVESRTPTHAVVQVGPRHSQFAYMEENLVRGMHSLEVALFAAFITEEFRTEAWELITRPEVLLSDRGRKLASKLVENYPERPPSGPAKTWIPDLKSEGAKELLGAVMRDTRMQMNRPFFEETIAGFRAKAAERELEALKMQEGDDRLALIQDRLQHKRGG